MSEKSLETGNLDIRNGGFDFRDKLVEGLSKLSNDVEAARLLQAKIMSLPSDAPVPKSLAWDALNILGKAKDTRTEAQDLKRSIDLGNLKEAMKEDGGFTNGFKRFMKHPLVKYPLILGAGALIPTAASYLSPAGSTAWGGISSAGESIGKFFKTGYDSLTTGEALGVGSAGTLAIGGAAGALLYAGSKLGGNAQKRSEVDKQIKLREKKMRLLRRAERSQAKFDAIQDVKKEPPSKNQAPRRRPRRTN
jgi:hypothetical protein